jgi:hypothetical protein
MKVELCESPSGDFFWFHTRWTNGKIATVSETYPKYVIALRLAHKFHDAMPGARFVNLTPNAR